MIKKEATAFRAGAQQREKVEKCPGGVGTVVGTRERGKGGAKTLKKEAEQGGKKWAGGDSRNKYGLRKTLAEGERGIKVGRSAPSRNRKDAETLDDS